MSSTAIQWTEHVWNPTVGCSILSPGCTNCYAMNMAARIEAMNFEAEQAGKPIAAPQYDGTTKKVNGKAVWTGKLALAPERVLLQPLKRKKPTIYFVNSMSDLFHESVPDEWIDRVFAVMALCPQHTFQVLTKRAKRMREYMTDPLQHNRMELAAEAISPSEDKPFSPKHVLPRVLPNVWLGVSTERQQEYDARWPELANTPAAVRFISYEPALGPLNIQSMALVLDRPTEMFPDWVICGGESGPDARPMNPEWARSLRDQCAAVGVAYFHKQNGEWLQRDCVNVSRDHGAFNPDGSFDGCLSWPAAQTLLKTHVVMERVGKKAAGRLLDGVEHNAMPQTN